jgi:uncharacterized cupin superfamily protein
MRTSLETVVPEAPLEKNDNGVRVSGEGWFVVNARDLRWFEGEMGLYTMFDSELARFEQVGVNIGILRPGEPNCMYHAEDAQEDFLVLSGECLLIVEGEERRLRAWDFVHCPPMTRHVFVGAGDGPCVVVGVGARRKGRDLVYPVEEAAVRYGAGVEEETSDPSAAYARFQEDREIPCPEEFLDL